MAPHFHNTCVYVYVHMHVVFVGVMSVMSVCVCVGGGCVCGGGGTVFFRNSTELRHFIGWSIVRRVGRGTQIYIDLKL